MTPANKRLTGILAAIALLLLAPLVAMQFTTHVNWSASDFVAAAILLLGAGLSTELVLRVVKKRSYRIAIALAVLFIFFLIWAELAVGLFGSPWAGS